MVHFVCVQTNYLYPGTPVGKGPVDNTWGAFAFQVITNITIDDLSPLLTSSLLLHSFDGMPTV
jgi:hypothetical protein